jgi:predicted short-subunit dehydrogenase-like oxidoreductase (DUF2520 family)
MTRESYEDFARRLANGKKPVWIRSVKEKGIYAIGAAISPAFAFVGKDGTLQRKKHTDLIYTAISDGIQAMEDIARRN